MISGFVLLYLAVVLIYPNLDGGFRFLLPVLPFLLIAMTRGLERFAGWIRRPKWIVAGFFWTAIFLSNFVNWQMMAQQQPPLVNGPQQVDAREALGWLRDNPDPNAVVMCDKPWAVHHYTGLTTMNVLPDIEQRQQVLVGRSLLVLDTEFDEQPRSHQDQLRSAKAMPQGKVIQQNEAFRLMEYQPKVSPTAH